MTFSDEWHALGREAEFAAESMAIGGNSIRKCRLYTNCQLCADSL